MSLGTERPRLGASHGTESEPEASYVLYSKVIYCDMPHSEKEASALSGSRDAGREERLLVFPTRVTTGRGQDLDYLGATDVDPNLHQQHHALNKSRPE